MATLREQVDQKKKEINDIIAAAIENGATVDRGCYGTFVDGMYIGDPSAGTNACILVEMVNPVIKRVFEPTTEQLQKEREDLKKRLEELNNTIAERVNA